MCGAGARFCPSGFLNRFCLPFAVFSVLGLFAFYEVHIGLEESFVGDVSIIDRDAVGILPFRYFFVIAFIRCGDPFGKDVSFFIFPAVLQVKAGFGIVLDYSVFGFADTGGFYLFASGTAFIVKLKGYRTFVK